MKPKSIVIYLAISIVLGLTACSPPKSDQANSSQPAAEQKTIGSLSAADFVALANSNLIPHLKSLNRSSVQGWSGAADVLKTFEFMNLHAQHANELEMTIAQKETRTTFFNLLKQKQVALFPLMRVTYGQEYESNLGASAAMRAIGPKYKTLQITSLALESADTAEQAKEIVLSMATKLRFNKIILRYSLGGRFWTSKVFGDADDKIGF